MDDSQTTCLQHESCSLLEAAALHNSDNSTSTSSNLVEVVILKRHCSRSLPRFPRCSHADAPCSSFCPSPGVQFFSGFSPYLFLLLFQFVFSCPSYQSSFSCPSRNSFLLLTTLLITTTLRNNLPLGRVPLAFLFLFVLFLFFCLLFFLFLCLFLLSLFFLSLLKFKSL